MSEERLRCRWCNASFLKWRTTKDDRRVSAWPRLRDHIQEYHPTEFETMQNILGSEDDDNGQSTT